MPVKYGRCGNKWCVREPDGSLVPGGKHDTEEEARAHAAAINANTEKEEMTTTAETVSFDADSSADEGISTTTSTANPSYTITTTATWPFSDKTDTKETETKFGEDVFIGPESFEELDMMRMEQEKDSVVVKLVNDFMSLVGNIFSWPGNGKSVKIKKLAEEMIDRLPDEEDDEMKEFKEKWTRAYINDLPDSAFLFIEPGGSKDSDGKTKPRTLRHLPYKDSSGKVDAPHLRNAIQRAKTVKLANGSKISEDKANQIIARAQKLLQNTKDVDSVEEQKNGFWVWKQANGIYRWLGVYSNKYRDDDNPAEILSEKAHVDFIERVEKGELDYPDLYVWHVKSPIGKADLLAYDDTGFSIASGTIKEAFALALMNTSEDLAMSHGMPSQFIERSKEDPTVITSYVSTEVSVLPRRAAANKRTDFRILKEEATMSIVPAEKRQQIADFLGEDLTAKLEAGLESKAQEAVENGVEFKEEGAVETDVVEEVDSVEETATETTAEETEQEAEPEVKEEADVQVQAKAEETVEDETAANPEGEVGDEAADGDVFVNKQELAATLSDVLTAFADNNQKIVEAIKGLNDRLDAIEAKEQEASEQASTQEQAKLVASTPEASLQDLLRMQLSKKAVSVIGTKEAAVHGNSSLANAKPQETEYDEENPSPKDGLFWHRW